MLLFVRCLWCLMVGEGSKGVKIVVGLKAVIRGRGSRCEVDGELLKGTLKE